jgi:hypothetical protein
MIPEAFDALFTREALRPFQPRPGKDGLTPTLEVHTTTAVLVFVLALDDFNDWDRRHAYLAGLGRRCAQEGHTIHTVRFGSECWLKSFTPEEEAARGDRLVETYPDREECIVVMGQTATGETRLARARLYRRPTGKVERLGTWEVEAYARMRSPLLDAFWRGYRVSAN